ncbi:MAG: hypothetical protein HYV09_24140 [Deltaproteobacteria bacterium]|nr:hypothetical protein [Deltaproteobacteria bacterium]
MNPWKLSTLILAPALVLVIGGAAVNTAGADDKKKDDKKEAPQPKMESAKDFLDKAHEKLEKATPDKGGHRVKAMKLIKDAIEEVELGIKWDNEHVSKEEAEKKNKKK